MIYLAYFILNFSVIQWLVALVNLIFRQSLTRESNSFNGLISVLIPARNEERNIGCLLTDLQNQYYQNIEILVFNDLSTDKTKEIVLEKSNVDKRIKLINSNGLPDGWLGKNHACHSLSKQAKGAYYLFLDADVRIQKNIIISAVSYSEKYKLGLLSIFPRQIMITIGERITVPNMNYILLSLLPLILVRTLKFPSLAAENGQFMLFNSANYLETSPHEKKKTSKVEDIEIARYFKQNHIPIACLTGNNWITCRMYEGFNDAVHGFSKNIFAYFGNSFVLALIFWLTTTIGCLIVSFWLSSTLLMIYLSIILVTRIFISILSRQKIAWNLILLVPQQLTLGWLIYKALINISNKQYQWKGRQIS
jgi:glycosyltransferase involved in cell wall biosynthesis